MKQNIDFIANAFAGCRHEETPWLAGFTGDASAQPHSVWFGRSALPLPAFIRDQANNYICISTFKAGTKRSKANWQGLWLVLLDDIGTKVDAKKLRLEPSCLVETSPDNFQAWYFLRTPERDQARAEALINGLIAAGVTDPGAGNLTRYGRLPTGINGKAKYQDKYGEPFTQRLHVWEPSRRYTADEIAAAYDIDLTPKPAPQRRSTAPKGADGTLTLLDRAGLYLEAIRGTQGGHRIKCPWFAQHTDQDTTGTAYFEPAPGNQDRGGFKCQHGHCAGRTIADLDHFLARLVAGGAA